MATTPLEWSRVTGPEVPELVALTQTYFESEADDIFTTDPIVLAHNLTRAVVDQFYDPARAFLWRARQEAGLAAYVWAERGQQAPWSRDEMVAIKIVHLDLGLSVRVRLALCDDMITLWENWATSIGVPVVCSTTMRADQEGFLRLHERRGYERRGSICYRRMLPA